MSERKATILYVDDDQGLLDAMRAVLESSGYAMVEARSGEEGLQVYREQRPDFVIVDLMMEEVDAGTRLVKELKAEGNTAPIYLLSSVGIRCTCPSTPWPWVSMASSRSPSIRACC